MNDWISIGAMWHNEDDKYGLAFSNDHITNQLKLSQLSSIVKIFKNDYKKEEKHPDYKLFIHRDELNKLGLVFDEPNEPQQSEGMTTEMSEPETPVEDEKLPF